MTLCIIEDMSTNTTHDRRTAMTDSNQSTNDYWDAYLQAVAAGKPTR